MSKISNILGDFLLSTPKGDNLIIVAPFIYNNFSLPVPLNFSNNKICRNFKNMLKFYDIIKFLMECYNINIYIITRKESASDLLKELKNSKNIHIIIEDRVHAKLLINKKFILLTSANLFYKSIYINYETIEVKENIFNDSFEAFKEYLPDISL